MLWLMGACPLNSVAICWVGRTAGDAFWTRTKNEAPIGGVIGACGNSRSDEEGGQPACLMVWDDSH